RCLTTALLSLLRAIVTSSFRSCSGVSSSYWPSAARAKKTCQNGLANVHGVDQALEPRVDRANADGAANVGFGVVQQVRRRIFLAGAHAANRSRNGFISSNGSDPVSSVSKR